MDLRDLRYFETLATLQHFGKAAEALHRTQPALTSCVRRLEDECGTPLFRKTGRGVRLTAAGEVLLHWAQRLRANAEDARREVESVGKGLAGHVRVGLVPTAAECVLPPAARQLLEEAPDITLRTVVGLVDQLTTLLRRGELDIIVGTERPTEPGYVSDLVAEDEIVVVAVAGHEVFSRPLTIAQLSHYGWALQPPGAPTREWLDQQFDRWRLPRPRVQVESTMLLNLSSLVAQTGLLSFVSRHHIRLHGAAIGLRAVELKETTMRRRLVVTYRGDQALSPAASRLVSLLADRA